MKRLKTLYITLLLVLSVGASAQGISFLDNRPMKEVLEKAKKEGKMVVGTFHDGFALPFIVEQRHGLHRTCGASPHR